MSAAYFESFVSLSAFTYSWKWNDDSLQNSSKYLFVFLLLYLFIVFVSQTLVLEGSLNPVGWMVVSKREVPFVVVPRSLQTHFCGTQGPCLCRGQAKEREGEKQPAILPSSIAVGKDRCELETRPCLLPVVSLWFSYFTSLNPNFLIFRMEFRISLPGGLLLHWHNIYTTSSK